jgi:hypothetical protein
MLTSGGASHSRVERDQTSIASDDLDFNSINLTSDEEQEMEVGNERDQEIRRLATKMAKEIAREKAKPMALKMAKKMIEKRDKKKNTSQPSSPKKNESSSKREYHNISFDYSRLNSSNASYSSVPIGKPPNLNGLNYAEWSCDMKMHLISLHPSLWEVVTIGVEFPKEGEKVSSEMMQDLHRNAQATCVINSCLSPEERKKVKGIEVAKVIWDKLQMAHEGDHKAKLGKIELIQDELDSFVMVKGETLQSLFDRLMVLINDIKSIGSKEFDDDHKVTRRFLRAYQVKNMSLARMIRDRDDYETMSPHTLLGRLLQHERADQAAIAAAERVPNAVVPHDVEGKTVALKATKEIEASKSKGKSKKIVEVSSSDESSEDEGQEMAMFIKTFKKMMRGGNKYKRRFSDKYNKDKYRKRRCYECGENGHYIAECPKKKEDHKERKKDKYKEDKGKSYNKKTRGYANVGEEWDSNDESSSSEEEGIASVTIQKTSSTTCLFTNLSDDEDEDILTCFMAREKKDYSGGSSWVLDSGCTNHMTGEKSMLTTMQLTDNSQKIIFGDSGKGGVIGMGNISISSNQSLSNVLLVDSLSYNLLSVSQLCEMGYNCLFTDEGVQILRREDSSIAFTGRLKGKLYLVDFTTTKVIPETCLVAKSDMGWLWHRRLAHVGMRNLAKLLKGEHILGLTNVVFEKDRVCGACQAGKQVGVLHPAKNIVSTTRPLELLHMDLFGPVAYISIGGNKYGLVIIDDYSHFTWVFFLHDKVEVQDTLKRFMRRAQNEFEVKIKKIRSDNGR